MPADRLAIADWLLDAGLGASARTVLRDLRGPEVSDRRRVAAMVRPAPGIHALVADDERGLVLPVLPAPGFVARDANAFSEACARAHDATVAISQTPELPPMRLRMVPELRVEGASIGLPAALAFLTYCCEGRRATRPVFATGAIDPRGGVQLVAALGPKLSAAAAEAGDALVIVPAGSDLEGVGPDLEVHAVSSVADAAAIVFGPPPYLVRRDLVDLARYLAGARIALAAEELVELLERLRDEVPFEGDRVRIAGYLVAELRHLGRSEEAQRAAVEALLETESGGARAVGASVLETQWIQRWLSEIDLFRFDAAVEALASRLATPFAEPANELRCRGALAQALAMRGDRARAIEVRRQNVALHGYSRELAKLAPGTHCYLALDAAALGRADAFDHHAAVLTSITRPGDENQARYNAAALLRGLVYLGRHDEALEVARSSAPPSVIAALDGRGSIERHPEVSIARALIRALRRRGDHADAIALAGRVRATGAGLVAWVAALAGVEGALANHDAGKSIEAARGLAESRRVLREAHEAASAFHGGLFADRHGELDAAAIERALDNVWY